jgi:hypothetical protein
MRMKKYEEAALSGTHSNKKGLLSKRPFLLEYDNLFLINVRNIFL